MLIFFTSGHGGGKKKDASLTSTGELVIMELVSLTFGNCVPTDNKERKGGIVCVAPDKSPTLVGSALVIDEVICDLGDL